MSVYRGVVPEQRHSFNIWIQKVKRINPEPDADIRDDDLWRGLYNQGLTPIEAVEQAFEIDEQAFPENPLFETPEDYLRIGVGVVLIGAIGWLIWDRWQANQLAQQLAQIQAQTPATP